MFIMIFCSSLYNVKAISVTLNCPSSVKPGTNFNCTINANYEEEYGGVELTPSFSSGISFNNFTLGSGYLGAMNTSMLSVYTNDNKKGNSVVGVINVLMNSNTTNSQTISFSNVKIIDANFEKQNCNDYSVTINVDNSVKEEKPSTNNNQNNNKSNWYNNTDNKVNNDSKEISTKIENIKLSSGELKFNKDIYKYDIEVGYDITKLDLDIKLEDEKASVKVSGNDNLKVGNNVITIVVTGKDNKNTTYTINVNRLDRSSNSNLKGLKIKGYKIKFASDKYEYYVNIKNNDIGKSLDIEAIPEDEKARVVIGGNKDIDTGKYINIIVEAEDGSTSMYTIKIINYHIGEFIYGMIGALLSIIIISIIVIIKKKRK